MEGSPEFATSVASVKMPEVTVFGQAAEITLTLTDNQFAL